MAHPAITPAMHIAPFFVHYWLKTIAAIHAYIFLLYLVAKAIPWLESEIILFKMHFLSIGHANRLLVILNVAYSVCSDKVVIKQARLGLLPQHLIVELTVLLVAMDQSQQRDSYVQLHPNLTIDCPNFWPYPQLQQSLLTDRFDWQ